MTDFKYDVAFSFLAEDEELAQRLADIVNEQYEVFLYSERQKELAGKDGEQEFNAVFSKQARMVVVFYRGQWGKTAWTRIEETAIKGRAFDAGYDFTLFIPLDDPKSVPPWLPKNRLYLNLERFGENAAAAVICSRIMELSGSPRPASPIDEAKRLAADLAFKKEVENWRISGEGIQQVIQTIETFYENLENQISLIVAENPSLQFKSQKGKQRDFVISYQPISMTFDLHIVYSNSLEHVSFIVRHWDRIIIRGQPVTYFEEPKIIFEEQFIPELSRNKEVRWALNDRTKRPFSNQGLLERCMKGFMDKIRKV